MPPAPPDGRWVSIRCRYPGLEAGRSRPQLRHLHCPRLGGVHRAALALSPKIWGGRAARTARCGGIGQFEGAGQKGSFPRKKEPRAPGDRARGRRPSRTPTPPLSASSPQRPPPRPHLRQFTGIPLRPPWPALTLQPGRNPARRPPTTFQPQPALRDAPRPRPGR